MVAILSLLTTLAISLLFTRVAAIALTLTGLSREVARFQARSAFTGVGFSTSESESIVNHPVRRRIVMVLMLFGNLGIAAVVASTIASFSVSADEAGWQTWVIRFAWLIAGLLLLWALSASKWVDQTISRAIEYALLKWTRLDVCDYVSLLRLSDGYVVMELQLSNDDWVTDRTLAETRLSKEGVLVLGIHRTKSYIGSPNGEITLRAGDSLLLYGPINRLEELDLRKKGDDGDRAHRIAVKVQEEITKDDVRVSEQVSDTRDPKKDKSSST